MRILAIDPGVAHIGWAVIEDGELLDLASLDAPSKCPWAQKRQAFVNGVDLLLDEWAPDVVVIEETQVATVRNDDRRQPLSPQTVSAMAVNTQRTEELAGELGMRAVLVGAEVVRIHPSTGRARLGVKHGATDRQTSEACNARFGTKLLVKEHHAARAVGIGLAAEAQLRLRKAGA